MALELQRARIIGVTKFISQLLEDAPITLRPFTADSLSNGCLRFAVTLGENPIACPGVVARIVSSSSFCAC
jgi:hypothetical protein